MTQPDIATLLADAREIYGVFGKDQQALAVVEKALALDPTSVEALNLKASILYDLDRDDEAYAFHQQALAVEPQSVEALHGLASLANDAGKYADAIAWADKGFAAFPHDPHPEMQDNEDYRQRLLAELYNEKAFALWFLWKRDEAVRLLTIEGPDACPLEIENFEDELAWLEEHPESPED